MSEEDVHDEQGRTVARAGVDAEMLACEHARVDGKVAVAVVPGRAVAVVAAIVSAPVLVESVVAAMVARF
jgi:hypothetical protein